MLKTFTLFSFFLIALVSLAPVLAQTNNPPEWEWHRNITGNAFSRAIVVDSRGNSYIAGHFEGSITIGNTTLTTDKTGGEGYVAKFDAAGKDVWAIKVGGDATHLTIDSKKNIYVTGFFKNTGRFGSVELKSQGAADFYLVKLSTEGHVHWAINATALSGNGATAAGRGVGVDETGHVYVTGTFNGKMTVGDISLTSQDEDLFLLKVDASGRGIWARRAGGEGYHAVQSMAVDATGNSFLTGYFKGSAQFGPVTIASQYKGDHILFIAKYNAAGEVVWVKKTGGSETYGNKIALDRQGFIFLAGWYSGSAPFGSSGLYAPHQGIFLTKYDAAGNVVWARGAGGYWNHSAQDVTTDSEGNSYITGYFTHKATFGDLVIETQIGSSFYAAKYNPEGKEIWVKQFGSPKSGGMGNGIAVDALGNCYIAGNGNQNAFIGIDQYEDRSDKFVAKLASDAGPTILTSNLPELSYCIGATVPVSFLKSGTYATGNSFTVQLSDASGSFANPVTIGSGQDTPIMAVLPAGIAPGTGYRIRVVAAAPATVGRESSIPVSIVAVPAAPTAIPAASCGSGRVTLSVAGARAGEVYNWYASATGDAVLASGVTFTTPVISTTIHYYVSLINNTGCESGRTLVTAIIDPALDVLAGSDEEVCIGGGELQLSGFSPAGGTWSGAGVNAAGVFNPALAGAGPHTLTYTYDNGRCAGSSTKVVRVTPVPAVVAGFEPLDCGTADSPAGLAPLQVNFTNSTTGATAYLWEFGDGMTSQEARPRHTYSKTGSYEVYLTTYYGNNCSSRQKVTTVQVERRNENANVFTPNGDGFNDYFVLNVTCLPIHLKVFDRWGKLVFERANYQNEWDGKNQAAGIYYYQARASNGQTWKGWVELIL